MASTLRVDVTLPFKSGLPRDCAVNTFHFTGPDTPPAGGPAALVSALEDFYNAGTPSIASHLSDYIDSGAGAATIEAYSINPATGLAGAGPIFVDTFDLNGPSDTSALPLEVCACLSYRASTSPVTDARRRGRVYIGPLNHDAVDYGVGSTPPLLSSSFQIALAGAGTDLVANAGLGALGTFWAVYSRAGGATHIIDSGWVDNEFDTQRRRGIDATARLTW